MEISHPSVRPLPTIDARGCADARFPAFAGPWLVSCSRSGLVDTALNVATGESATISDPARSPGVSNGVLFATGQTPGLWRLAAGEVHADASVSSVPTPSLVPPISDGTLGAAAFSDHLQVWPLAEKVRKHLDARPLPGYALATAAGLVAWVERSALTGEDVWIRTSPGVAIPLARSPNNERHVVGSDRWFAWVDGRDVVVQDMALSERRRYGADAGFVTAPSMWGPVACWEDRAAFRAGTGDIDVHCSDGVEVGGVHDQRAPSRWGPYLAYRQDGLMMLATVQFLVLDDDDARAVGMGRTVEGGYRGSHRDAPVYWSLDWPATGWHIERWEAGIWQRGEEIPPGPVVITSPSGDAVRLAPS